MRRVTTSTAKGSGAATLARVARGLTLSCHPVPTIGVTALATVLAVVAGNRWPTVALVALAVLTGQLSIGWSNDLVDADRDIAVRRLDKPLAQGALSRGGVAAATALAAAATVPLSLALGWRAGIVHLVAVASGWVYNAGLKSTVLSVLPYVVTFGLFPAVATLPLPGDPWPRWWVLLAGALIGVSAHFGNVAPDLADDVAVCVRGLPQRLGRTACGVLACAAALAAVGVIVGARAADFTWLGWLLAAAAAAAALTGLTAVRRNPSSEAAFYGAMVTAALSIALLATSGGLP